MATEYPKVYLYRRIVRAKLFIDEHYMRKIDLDNIADEAHFSKYHFIRQFGKIYGKTPYQYLRSVRIEKAKEMIASGMQISDACLHVGFESFTSFSGAFKRIVGVAPLTFARNRKHLSEQIAAVPLGFIPGCFAESNGWKKSNFEDVRS